jgi:hypothetical protein
MVEIALSEAATPEGRLPRIQEKVAQNLVQSAQEHGVSFSADRIRELLALDIALNGQGLEIWLQRRAKAA